MNKKLYESPVLRVTEIETTDVITVSFLIFSGKLGEALGHKEVEIDF